MMDIALMIAVLGVFAFGFYITKHVDNFLDENYKNMHINAEKIEPTCVMLTDNMSEDEMIKEILAFKEKHGKVSIYLCDSDDVLDGRLQEFIDK